ncbi:hypothetical protein B1L11_05195 [Microbispora sp. GKU 823]|nr:hypothetical protein B1L11_05195 [Microbispora sp. GKU 823]
MVKDEGPLRPPAGVVGRPSSSGDSWSSPEAPSGDSAPAPDEAPKDPGKDDSTERSDGAPKEPRDESNGGALTGPVDVADSSPFVSGGVPNALGDSAGDGSSRSSEGEDSGLVTKAVVSPKAAVSLTFLVSPKFVSPKLFSPYAESAPYPDPNPDFSLLSYPKLSE